MPVVPSSAYATAEGSLNLARALVNDMLVNQSGEILTDGAPFTFVMLNEAADYMYKELANHGMGTFVFETVISPITPIGINDPGVQVVLSDAGYNNGVTNINPPQLPTDLLDPLDIWERETGTTQQWILMQRVLDGLPSVVQSSRLGIWEWREEAIYMVGANQSEDLRLRYTSMGPMFVLPTDTLMVRGAQNALANLLAAVFTSSRNPAASANFSTAGDYMIRQIYVANTRSKQRVTRTRQSYGSMAGRSYR